MKSFYFKSKIAMITYLRKKYKTVMTSQAVAQSFCHTYGLFSSRDLKPTISIMSDQRKMNYYFSKKEK